MSFDIVQIEVNNDRLELTHSAYGQLIRYVGPYNHCLAKLGELSAEGYELKTTHLSSSRVCYSLQRSRGIRVNQAPAIEI